MKVGVLTSWDNPFLTAFLSKLVEKDLGVRFFVFVDGKLSDKNRAIWRDRIEDSFLLKSVLEINLPELPFFFLGNHNGEEVVRSIKNLGINYLVNVGTPRKLQNAILQSTSGVLNAHPGVLPRYRGSSALEWSIYEDNPVGVTVHFMNENYDEGPIVMVRKMNVSRGETYKQIRTRMLFHQASTLLSAIEFCFSQKLCPSAMKPQEEGRYYEPIPDEKLGVVKAKLEHSEYECAA